MSALLLLLIVERKSSQVFFFKHSTLKMSQTSFFFCFIFHSTSLSGKCLVMCGNFIFFSLSLARRRRRCCVVCVWWVGEGGWSCFSLQQHGQNEWNLIMSTEQKKRTHPARKKHSLRIFFLSVLVVCLFDTTQQLYDRRMKRKNLQRWKIEWERDNRCEIKI